MALDFNSGYGLLLKRVALSFIRAFLGVFLVGVLNIASSVANTHDWSAGKAAVVALISAAVVAGIKAVQELLALGSSPSPQTGTSALSE